MPQESGELCLMSCLLGENRDIFFPKLDHNLNLITFSEIAERYLNNLGYEPVQCKTEDEARKQVKELKSKKPENSLTEECSQTIILSTPLRLYIIIF